MVGGPEESGTDKGGVRSWVRRIPGLKPIEIEWAERRKKLSAKRHR